MGLPAHLFFFAPQVTFPRRGIVIMNEQLAALERAAAQAVGEATGEHELQQVKARFLGKNGELTAILKGMGALPADQRPAVGALANQVKERLEALFNARFEALRAAELQRKLNAERLD